MVQKVAVVSKKLSLVQTNEVSSVDAAAVPVAQLFAALPPKLLYHPMLANVLPSTLQAIVDHFSEIRLATGMALYRVDQRADRMFFVVDGTMQTLHHNRAGESFEGDWRRGSHALAVSEMFSQQTFYTESAFARSAVELFALPISLVRDLAMKDPALAMNLGRALAERQHRAFENERSVLETGYVRVAEHLIRLVVRDGKEVAPDLYQIKSTQEEIASAAGLNARTVARAMKELQKMGRLYIRRGEYVLRQPLSLVQAFADEAGHA